MVKNDSKYWERRKANLIYRQMDKAESKADDIDKIYNEAQQYLNRQANKVFDKFQRDYGLSETDARKVIKDMNGKQNLSEMRKILEARPDDPNINQLLADMDSAAYAFRIRQFENLNKQVDKLRSAMYHAEKGQSDRFYMDFMKDSYNRATFDLQQKTGLAYSFSTLPEAEIRRLRALKWSGDNYSSRIWDNTGELARQLKNEFLVSLMTGRSNRDVINLISERFNAGRNNARRLVRTESAFFHNEMEALSYEEADIEQYRFIAVLDKRTSEICREHDNKIYKVSERKTGVNYPPLHPWCRSTTVAHFDDVDLSNLERRARDPETGKTQLVPADMSYDEWHDKYIKNHTQIDSQQKDFGEIHDDLFGDDVDKFFNQQKSYQNWLSELPASKVEAIHEYTTAVYDDYNRILRKGKDNFLKEITGGEPQKLSAETIKWYNDIEVKANQITKAISDYKTEKIFKTYRLFTQPNEDFLKDSVGNTLIIDKGLMSTSLDKSILEDFGGGDIEIQLNITVKKGQSVGAYIGELSSHAEEKEFLIKPNTKFKVLSEDIQELAFDRKRKIYEVEVVE
ncbi:minor capsid protein [Streptococcus constellatus]|uniref:minor capsid protein n=1 Tax=Streptococcus constellatus TaxID=76860 RepID=UPI00069FAD04|nr:minor capsid protein [Streptococcus constellatus]